MPKEKVWTADELLAMTPNDRHEIVTAGIITDLDEVPLDLLERARADIRSHIAKTEAESTTEQ